MRQFDVCRLRGRRAEQLVVILQHDLVDDLETRIVAPLSDKPFRKLIAGLRLPVVFDGSKFILQIDRLAAIDRREIGAVAGSLATEEQRIKNALDLAFFGV
jgi:toxin CcdB